MMFCYFWPTFHIFLVTREKVEKIIHYISHSHTHMYFAHPIDFALPIMKKIRIYQVWFLFGMIPGVDSYLHHFGTSNKKQNGEQNLIVMSTTDMYLP